MSAWSPRSPGCSPRHRRASSPKTFPLGSITELPEYVSSEAVFEADVSTLSMWKSESAIDDVRVDEGLYLSTSVDSRLFGRSKDVHSSLTQWKQSTIKSPVIKRWSIDRECGICFELAVNPRRTRCCGNIFCSEHLVDWLGGDATAGSCPSCQMICSINANTVSLASPPKPTLKRPYYQLSPTPNESSLSKSPRPWCSTIPPNSCSSSSSCAHSPWASPRYTSGSKSVPSAPISALPRASSPHCAPSRPNTPCSAFSHADSTDPPERLQSQPNQSDNRIQSISTVGSFALMSEDTGGLLLLAALTVCIYVILNG